MRRALAISLHSGVPFEVSLEARAMRLLVHLKLWGLIVAFSWTGLSGFDQPKSSWSRAAMWLLAAALVVALARYGHRIMPRSPLNFAVALLVGANALSAAFAEHSYTALFGERGRYLGLSFTVDMAVLYACVAIAFRDARRVAELGASVAAAGIVAIGYGIVQRIDMDPVSWRAGVASVRPFSTFGNANMFGHFLAALVCGVIAVAAFVRNPPARVLATGIALLAIALIAIIATRGAVVGLAGGLAVVSAYAIALRGRAALRPLALAALVTAVFAVGVALLTPLGARLAAIAGSPELADRVVIWEGAWRAFLLRPILGFGPDSLGVAFPLVRQPGTEAAHAGAVAVDQAHNWILHALATTGLVGFGALVGTVAAAAVVLWRDRLRSPAASAALLAVLGAYWANALVSVEAVSVSWIPWLVTGLAAAGGPASQVFLPRRWAPALAIAGVVAVALALALSGTNASRANDAMARGRLAMLERNAGGLTDAANEALSFDPGRGEYWNYRGIGRNLRGLFGLAAADYEEAASRTPHQTNFLGNLARARASQALAGDTTGGGKAAAYAAARRAIAVDPNLSSTHRALADVALAFGDHDLALSESLAAVRLHPRDAASDATIVAAALAHSDRLRARGVVEEILRLRLSETLLSARARLAAP